MNQLPDDVMILISDFIGLQSGPLFAHVSSRYWRLLQGRCIYGLSERIPSCVYSKVFNPCMSLRICIVNVGFLYAHANATFFLSLRRVQGPLDVIQSLGDLGCFCNVFATYLERKWTHGIPQQNNRFDGQGTTFHIFLSTVVDRNPSSCVYTTISLPTHMTTTTYTSLIYRP